MTEKLETGEPQPMLVRGFFPGAIELRDGGEGGMPTMAGHFTLWDIWTEIASFWEGNFMERIMRGSLKRTIQRKGAAGFRSLLNHGRDPSVGMKPIGVPQIVREDKVGGYYEVPMLDTSYNRDIIPGLEAGAYGASDMFRVVKEDWSDKPGTSAFNPKGLPERTIREMELFEFGPVTFPAVEKATAGIRSLTDFFRDGVPLGTPITELAAGRRPSEDGPATNEPEDSREHSEGLTTAQRERALALLSLGGERR